MRLCACRLSRPVAALAAGYVNGLRSDSADHGDLLVLSVGAAVNRVAGGAFTSALIAFTLFEAAYYSEIMCAGINGISGGTDGCGAGDRHDPGCRPTATWCCCKPCAARAPILLTQCIALFQDSSLVYVIGLHDFMTSIGIVANREARLIEFYLFAALVYFAICFSASRMVRRLQHRMATT